MFPKFALIEQRLTKEKIDDLPAAIEKELSRVDLAKMITEGMSVAITAGSRGIYQIEIILRQIVKFVRAAGGRPFIVPAMGSHGGATPAGQLDLLHDLNITATSIGAPIVSCLEVVQIGQTATSLPVFLDRQAARAGGIIAVARIKPHTDFRNYIESGLQKMLVIGLGKHRQAQLIHRFGVAGLKNHIPAAARVIIGRTPLLLGMALIENGYDQTAKVIALCPEEIIEREPELLAEANRLRPRLPFQNLDILLVAEIGKDISGTGMDTNIIGRIGIPGEKDFGDISIQYIVALGLTEASHGNALGIGLADFTTERLTRAIDYQVMRENVITSTFVERGKIPLAFPSDREAIAAALRCLWHTTGENARIAFIRNTKELDRLLVSESLLPELICRHDIQVLIPPRELVFNSVGDLEGIRELFNSGGAV